MRWWKFAAVAAVLSLAACDDDFFDFRWTASPDTAVIYSLARPELGPPSAFDFLARQPVRIEAPTATGRWDVALDTRDGRLELLPPGALGVQSMARILLLADTSFDAVNEAPGDSSRYVADRPLPLRSGAVYVVRTHEEISFGQRCPHYGKFTPVAVDEVAGTLRFLFDVNPFCSDRRLVPPN
ncbi:MAG: hypothetical protein HY704_12600 [Gemmatimonadetes bacterium]|nr:hypothetical protein [Gemmatimonadota bacterium]